MPWTKTEHLQAYIPLVEERFENLTKLLFEIYNYLATSDLKDIRAPDLFELKGIIESLRNFHCPILHNESRTNINDSRRSAWIEIHHSLFSTIRDHINDIQDDKIPFDYEHLASLFQTLTLSVTNLIEYISQIPLRQNFFVRIHFLKFHRKAIALHCALHHTPKRKDKFLHEKAHTSIKSESLFNELHIRIYNLIKSFEDQPHPLHTPRERIPHLDFTTI